MGDKKKMLTGMGGIGKLYASEECPTELNSRHGELENRISISEKITNGKLTKEKKEMKEIKEALRK